MARLETRPRAWIPLPPALSEQPAFEVAMRPTSTPLPPALMERAIARGLQIREANLRYPRPLAKFSANEVGASERAKRAQTLNDRNPSLMAA